MEKDRKLEAMCSQRRWLGVGRRTFPHGDARDVLHDESLMQLVVDNDDITVESVAGAVSVSTFVLVCLLARMFCVRLTGHSRMSSPNRR